jgi:predicted pyridoxine 5'-phosphate oxidase superfamily flavin-nucleotide-binding protein
LPNSPYERLRLDRKVEATDDGQMGSNDNDVGEGKHRSRSFLQRGSDTLLSYNVDGVSLEEARCVNDDDDLIYNIDDIANEDMRI